MTKSYRIVIIVFLLVQCKPSLQTIKGTFKSETYQYQVKPGSKHAEQIIFISDLPHTQLEPTELFKISKGSVVLLPFLSDSNKIRQQQLDNLHNRKDYYSELLQQIISDTTKYTTVVAEGLNANLLSQIAFAYPIDNLVLINPYKPNIEQCFISNCFNAVNPSTCDSLLKHFQLNDMNILQQLLKGIQEKAIDEQYGLYTLSFWNDVYRYQCDARSNKYNGKLSYVYINNSGLALPEDSIHTVSKKNFYKRLKKLINN